MTIYIVKGTTGEYDDTCLWDVKAFKDKEDALKFLSQCQAHADKEYINAGGRKFTFCYKLKDSPYDPKFDMDYTGTEYYIREIELC